MVPAKHRVNGFCELGVVPLVNTTGIDPEVLQVVASCLLTAEYNLTVAGFALARLVYY